MIALASVGAGCGKKGPPLVPVVRIPAGVQAIAARRVGGDVYVTVTVPAQNVDASIPADVGRVEVYGYTGVTPPARGRFLEGAAVVATVDVAPPVGPGAPAPAVVPEARQGMPVTVLDTLTPDELVPSVPVPSESAARSTQIAPPPAGPLRRFYMAIAFSPRGVPGPQGTVTELPLTAPPDPPSDLHAAHSADTLTLTWQPSGGLLGFLLDRALPVEAPPFDPAAVPAVTRGDQAAVAIPSGPTTYNVYRRIAPDPLELPSLDDAPPRARAPVPVNPAPLATLTFTEPVTPDERERCYTVRAVRGVPPAVVEGNAAPPACITPIDVFAPATPTGLAPIPSANAISLIWEPGTEDDLAGYLVLRGEAGGDTLARLTREPILEARFIDDTVTPGVRYVYHVIAVDSRLPLPNASAPAIIEETAR